MNIVAVVFGNYTQHDGFSWGEKPYFYLNMIEATTGTVALVHNGSNYGVVRVVRVINPLEHPDVVQRVNKPLLAAIQYDHSVIKEAERKLDDFRKATVDHRIDAAINEALGIDRPSQPTLEHQKAIQPEPRFVGKAERVRPSADKDLDDEIPL